MIIKTLSLQCVDEWLRVNASCPTCRKRIVDDGDDNNTNNSNSNSRTQAEMVPLTRGAESHVV